MALTRVNTARGSDYSGASAASIATAAQAHTAGGLLVVGWRAQGTTLTATLTDTAGNQYRRLGRSFQFTTSSLELWMSNNILGHATNVVTVNLSGSVPNRGVVVAHYSGQAVATPVFDISPTFLGEHTGTQPAVSPTFSTLVPDELIVGLSQVDALGTTWSPDTGFSTAVQDASNVVYLQDRIVNALQIGITVSVGSSSPAVKDFLVAAFTAPIGAGGGGGGGSRPVVGQTWG
jgi:hypothetical protein